MADTPDVPVHRALGLTDEEYADIATILGRQPNHLELAMYSVMWSEHCSYKSSRVHLGRFPTEAPWVMVGPGENAGVVDVGDGIALAMRIESHNHPSAIEPYQGAATGIGGILTLDSAYWRSYHDGGKPHPEQARIMAGIRAAREANPDAAGSGLGIGK